MKKIIFSLFILFTIIVFGADKKITDLTLLTSGSFATGDTIPIVDVSANETKKTTLGQLDNRYSLIGNYLTGLSGDVTASGPGLGVATISGLARSKLANGTASYVLINNGSGALSEEAQLAVSRGGTGLASGTSGGILGFTSSGVLASSSALTQYGLLVGGGVGATPSALTDLGTSTKVLHGNAAGNPTWSAVDIVNDTTGTLSIAKGGTGQTTSSAAFDALAPSQTANSGKFLTTNGTTASWGTVTADINALTGDVTASGSGSVAATVAAVGGKTAAQVATSVDDTLAATSANTASVIVKRDSSKNFLVNNIGTATTSTTTSNNATLTLTVASSKRQRLGGTGTNYKVKLPDATTLGQTGFSFYIDNRSSQDVSIIDNGSNVLYTVPTLTAASIIASSIGSSNGTWEIETAIGQPATDSASGYFSAADHSTFTTTNSTVSARTSANTASTIAARSSDGNIWTTAAFQKMTTTATAAGTTTLTVASSPIQIWTGTTTQTIKMPAANTLVQVGTTYKFLNKSTGTLTIQDNSAGAIATIVSGGSADVIVTNIGSAAGTWVVDQVSTSTGLGGSLPYRSVTTTDTTTTSDGFLKLSGASFTETLHTAVGNTGQILELAHNGTSLTQVYTLNTTSGQTIGGVASGSYKLVTNGEVLGLRSDGANWLIAYHRTETDWSSSATNTFVSSAANPVTKGTVVTDILRWRRRGMYAVIEMKYKQSATATANSGTYGYRVTIPANMTINTTLTGTQTSTDISDSMYDGNCGPAHGGGSSGGGTLSAVAMRCVVYDSTTVRFNGLFGGSQNFFGTGLTFASGANMAFGMIFEVPITDWQP